MIKARLVGLLSHAKKYIVYTVLWQWAALLSQIVAVFSIARLLEKTSQGTLTSQEAGKTAVILLAVVLVRFFCERMQTRSSYLACVDVKRILREKIYEKMLRLGASYREQVSSSEVVQVSTEGVEQLETCFGKYLPQLFTAYCSITAVSGAVKGLFKGQRHAAGVRALDSHFHCGSAEDCKAAFEQILEHLYRPWRFLSGKSSGADHLKNLSGRPVKSR